MDSLENIELDTKRYRNGGMSPDERKLFEQNLLDDQNFTGLVKAEFEAQVAIEAALVDDMEREIATALAVYQSERKKLKRKIKRYAILSIVVGLIAYWIVSCTS